MRSTWRSPANSRWSDAGDRVHALSAEPKHHLIGIVAEQSIHPQSHQLAHFGEGFPTATCGACDNCLEPRETYDGTVVAQKFLSCLYRIARHSGFSVGLRHVVAVLTGADNEKIRRWGHDQLTTYGIGPELDERGWSAVARELMRLGHVALSPGEFATLELTDSGLEVLRARTPIQLTKPMDLPTARKAPARRAGEVECDEILFARLRALRKELADERRVPAYIILGDAALRAMARQYPASERDMTGIPGMGERKREQFGALFAEEISDYLRTNSRQRFNERRLPPRACRVPRRTVGMMA